MNYKKPIELVHEKPYLFWYVKDKEGLSDEAIVEAILNRGDFDDFLKLTDIMGIRRVADGTVYYGTDSGGGKYALVKHRDDFWTAYWHLQ